MTNNNHAPSINVFYLSPIAKPAIVRKLRDCLSPDCMLEIFQILIELVKLLRSSNKTTSFKRKWNLHVPSTNESSRHGSDNSWIDPPVQAWEDPRQTSGSRTAQFFHLVRWPMHSNVKPENVSTKSMEITNHNIYHFAIPLFDSVRR